MIQIIILIVLILLNAFFSLSEIAVITLNDKKIKKMANDGHTKAIKVLSLIENYGDFLATIQVGVTLSGFLTSASASKSFSDPISQSLSFLNIPYEILDGVSTFIVTIILSYFSLVLGELVPKKIAMQYSETVSFNVVNILIFTSKIFRPFIKLLSSSTNVIIKILGISPDANEKIVTEEEILMLVDAGEEKGIIEQRAKDMIENIFDFDNISAEEIMTHRTDIVAAENTMSIKEVMQISIKTGKSRIPIFEEDLDNIIGILHVKDILKFVAKENLKNISIKDIIRPVMFIPNSKRCDEIFNDFTSNKTQIAIVVDEYGGTEGLITMEDLVESILGSIQDEYDQENEEIHRINDNTFTVDGTTPIDEIEETFKIKIPKGNYDTIAGFITSKLGKIPKKNSNEYISIENIKFIAYEVTERRISKVQVLRNSENDENK